MKCNHDFSSPEKVKLLYKKYLLWKSYGLAIQDYLEWTDGKDGKRLMSKLEKLGDFPELTKLKIKKDSKIYYPRKIRHMLKD